MASQEVRILAIRGNTLLVESESASACGSCRSKSQCGQDAGTVREIEVQPGQAERLRVRDTVSLGLPSGQLLRMAASVYLPPLLGLLTGMMIGATQGTDALSLAGGGFGFCAGLAVTRVLGRRGRAVVHTVMPSHSKPDLRSGCAG